VLQLALRLAAQLPQLAVELGSRLGRWQQQEPREPADGGLRQRRPSGMGAVAAAAGGEGGPVGVAEAACETPAQVAGATTVHWLSSPAAAA
jgi:hypothetical protein